LRGQPEVEEETSEFDDDGNPKMKHRKADDEHLIRKALLDARRIDAVVSLPLNVFYGSGVRACLLILRKQRPSERRDQVLLIYAARHYRELSAQNELRPQDVMRMLVHYHAYGDAAKVPDLVAEHSERIRKQIDLRKKDEVGRLQAEYQAHAERLVVLNAEITAARAKRDAAKTKGDKAA
jgi:type I restriction enzyme M protein